MRCFAIAIAATVNLALLLPAWADYDAGVVAYSLGDYTTALREFAEPANHGDARAQAFLGTIYSAGQGIAPDYVLGYLWLSLSAAQDNKTAQKYRERVEEWMTAEEIAEARKLLRDWEPNR